MLFHWSDYFGMLSCIEIYVYIGLYVLRTTISNTILNSVNSLKISQGVMKSCKSKKNRQYNDLQSITQKIKTMGITW